MGCHFILQGIFPTQGSNPCLLHWQADFLPLSYQESTIYFINSISGVYISTPISQFIPPLTSLLGVHVFILYICVSISVLQIRSSIPFFWIPHKYIHINMWYLFFSFWLHSFCVTVSRPILGLCLLAHFSLHYLLCSLGMSYLFPLLPHLTTSLLSSGYAHLTAFPTCLISISPLRLNAKNGLPLFAKQQPAYCRFRKSSEGLPSLSPSCHTRPAIPFAGQKRRCGQKEETFGHVRAGEGGMIWESSIETYTLPYVKPIAGGNLLYDAGNPKPLLSDSQDWWEGVGGGRRSDRGDTCVPMTDSCRCGQESTQYCSYPPIKNETNFFKEPRKKKLSISLLLPPLSQFYSPVHLCHWSILCHQNSLSLTLAFTPITNLVLPVFWDLLSF